ncbi:MAG TPA: hypothetical protein VFO60_04260, partial [Candidatus Dormibacteraeota bacterium]|nr:hypothetical protein [Candidatus Dormibacteraeota bacterium]
MATTLVHRPARTFAEPPPTAEIRLVPPPQVQPLAPASWLQYMLPLTGVLGSVGFIAVYNQGMSGSGRLLYLALVVGGTLLAMAGGVAVRRQQVVAQRRQRRATDQRYVAYLAREEERIRRVAEIQRGAAARVHPDAATVLFEIARRDRLWERRPEDGDFLQARVGVGAVPLACPLLLEVGNNPLVEYDPRLLGLAQGLVDAYATVPSMPAAIGLGDQGSVVVCGPTDRARGLVRSVLCELAGFHSPDDLHVLAAFPASAAASWEWLKWLPHVRRGRTAAGGVPACRLADGPDELEALLEEEVGPRLEQLRRGAVAAGSSLGRRLVVVVDGMSPSHPLARVPALVELMERGRAAGAVVIGITRSRRDDPSTVSLRVDVDDDGILSVEETHAGGRRLRGASAADAPLAVCEAVARALAPLR